MLALIPYRVDALYEHDPVANWAIIGLTCLVSLAAMWSPGAAELLAPLVLAPGHLLGLPGHLLLHAGMIHLIGNMMFLWVFGNIVAANMGQVRYLIFYVILGVVAGLVHIAITGVPAIGASGAINGIIGMTVAAYPRDRVHTFWLVFIRWGTISIRLWILVLIWLFFDISGVLGGGDDIAHWAHIGGLLAGVGLGLLALLQGWIHMTRFDPPTMLEILGGPPVERK